MAKYIDKDAIVTEIERYKHKADERLKIKNRALLEDMKDLALQNLCGNLLNFGAAALSVSPIHGLLFHFCFLEGFFRWFFCYALYA